MSKCSQTVNRGDSRYSIFQPCDREAVEDGLCKMHLNARNKRRENDRKWREEYERGQELQAEAERLSALLDTDVDAYYNAIGKGGYTGDFVVPGEWLRKQVKS